MQKVKHPRRIGGLERKMILIDEMQASSQLLRLYTPLRQQRLQLSKLTFLLDDKVLQPLDIARTATVGSIVLTLGKQSILRS